MPTNPLKPKGASTGNDPNKFKTAAQREAERQAASYAGRTQQQYNAPTTLNDEQRIRDAQRRQSNNPMDQAARDWYAQQSQREADLEAQRRYDSSGNGGNTDFYKDAARYLSPGQQNPNPVAPGAPQGPGSGGYPSGGSSGGGGASAAPQMTLEEQIAAINGMTGTIDPTLRALVPTSGEIELMYKRLTDSLGQNKQNVDADYDAAINAVKGNYANSNQFINQAISGDQASLAQAAANLGVDPNQWKSGATAQSQTEMLNRLLGVGGQNQAADLAWFEKMSGLDQAQFADMMNFAGFQKQGAIQGSQDKMLELQKLADEAARNQAMLALQEELVASGGSGGGGGGGGSGRRGFGGGGGKSSASSVYKTLSQTATETGKLDFAGLANEISALPADLQGIAWDYWVLGGASGEGAAKQILQDRMNGTNRLGGDQATLDYLYQIMLGYTPGVAPISTQTVQDKSAQSTKVYGVPPISQGPSLPAPSSGGRNSGLTGISNARKKTAANSGAKTPPKGTSPNKSVKDLIKKLF